MSSVAVGAIVFVCTFAGAMIGMYASSRLPDHHLSPASTAVMRLAMAFVVALATLVISLMIASATTSFATKDAEYRRGAADLILLDRTMAHYGPETKNTRDLLRRVAEAKLWEFWPEDSPPREQIRPIEIGTGIEKIEDELRALEPKDNAQRSLQARALQSATNVRTARRRPFRSSEISVDAVLASACLPQMMSAVEIDGEPYWDGGVT